MTRRMSAILGEYSPAGQGCTRHFSVPPLEYKNLTSYKKYRPEFGLNILESRNTTRSRSSSLGMEGRKSGLDSTPLSP